MRSLIIIPTYNEYENLGPLLEQIFSFVPGIDLLIVDDNSPDGTGRLADEMADANRLIHVMHRAGKLGLGTAYIAGFKYAVEHGYDVAFEMDADFSHDPRYLPDFLEAIKEADLVIGSRYVPKGGNTELVAGPALHQRRWQYIRPFHAASSHSRLHRRLSLLPPTRVGKHRSGYH
ncbi:MAG TPA: glycosyltransferase [Ktedonobacteraceae bacterium]|nr:glycosyltransferase [Ktedonobacteraceae bacterium]